MKKWLIPLIGLALVLAASVGAGFALTGNGTDTPQQENTGVPRPAGMCAEDAPGCNDTLERSDDGIDPNECNLVHNITACEDEAVDPTGPVEEPPGDLPPIRSDEDNDPNECNLVHNITACEDEALDPAGPVDEPCDPVPLRSDCGIDPDECNLVHNITACEGDTVDPLFPDGEPQDGLPPLVEPPGDLPSTMPVPDDADTCEVIDDMVICPDMIVEPPDPGDVPSGDSEPHQCNEVHNITACEGTVLDPPGPAIEPSGEGDDVYEVTVQFNTSVTQEDLQETEAILRAFDDDLQFLIQESFPPTGRAFLETDASDFCSMVEEELEAKSYVDSVSCQPWQESKDAEPDVPVEHRNDLTD